MPTLILFSLISFIIFFFLSINPTYAATVVVKDVSVGAKTAWTDSGIDVVANDRITLKQGFFLNQIVYTPGGLSVPPNGLKDCTADSTFVATGLVCYSLILRIGDATAFNMGFNTPDVTFTASSSGRLYLGFNDKVGSFSDNSGGFGFTVIINRTIIPTPTPTPIPSSKTPLIFIPGIGGSELKTTDAVNWSSPDGHGGVFRHAYPAGERVWVNEEEARALGNDDYFDILRLKPDGQTSEAKIELNGSLYDGTYKNTLDFFISNGYTLNTDFFIFPYDWRKDIALTVPLLDQRINQIKQQTGSQKVDIVAHSMGGLVARNYIANIERAQKTRRLITLGTPYLGTVKMLKTLRYGDCLTDRKLENLPFCLGIVPNEIKDVLQNMIGAYELAPSQSYFTFYSGEDNLHPLPFADTRDIDSNNVTGGLNYAQIKTLFTNLDHNTSLFTPSEAFHALDNNLSNTNGVDVTYIVGSGMATLGQIVEKYSIDFAGIQIPHRDEIPINGDETVPLFSSALVDTGKNISLLGNAKAYYTNQKHGDLSTSGPALHLVKNILNGDNTIPSGVSTQPYPFNGTRISVHSPVNIHAYDSTGHHTGSTANGDFETNIPGSSYDTLDDAKFIWLPNNGQYTIKLEATDQGSFDFKIRKFENDTNTSTILYNDIPLTTATKAQTSINTSSAQAPTLQVDKDGNGNTDFLVTPSLVLTGSPSSDEIPPQTSIGLSGTPAQNAWYKSDVIVTLQAIDETNGSGIDKVEYSLDNGETVQVYSNPFTISQEGVAKLKFRTIDKAGNQEVPQEKEIKIDKAVPEARVFIDQDKQDMVIEGIDVNPVTMTRMDNKTTKKKDDAIYTIADAAGNTLKLDVRERDKEKQDRFRIYSMQYNQDPLIVLENNHFNVAYQGKKDKLNVKEQSFEIKGEIKIRLQYNVKKNESTVVIKTPQGEKVKGVIPGLILLKLVTSGGQLYPQY